MTESKITAPSGESAPKLGSFSATCIVIGAIIGIGIFFTPTSVAKSTGSMNLAMIAWIIGGFIAMMGALTFAELGSRCASNGGQYQILRDAWSAPVGFAYVFCNATIIQAGAIAIIALITAVNLGTAIQGESLGDTMNFVIAFVTIVGLTIANAVGVKWGAGIQNATVIAKIVTLLLITNLAYFAPMTEEVIGSAESVKLIESLNDTSPFALVFAGLVPVFFSFGGWQHALWVGGEIKKPRRNIPLAIIIGLTVVTTVYLLANWAYFRLLDFYGVVEAKALAAEAVAKVFPNGGQRIVAAAIAVSGFGVLNAQLLSGPRLINGMAREGKFFKLFAKSSELTGTPLAAIVMLGGLGLILLSIFGDIHKIDVILNGVVLVDAVFFFVTGLALFRLRYLDKLAGKEGQGGESEVGFRVPFFPIVPGLFVLGEILVLTGAFMLEKYRNGAWIGITWIIAAFIFYAIFFREDAAAKKPKG